jgi:hypothetical protein
MSKQKASTGGEPGAGERGSTATGSGVTSVEKGANAKPRPSSAQPVPPELHTPAPSSPGAMQLAGKPNIGLHAAIVTPPAHLVRLGRYQVVDRIATGGMAEVYLAVHGELAGFRTPVVLKKVLPHLASNPQFIDMFLDEARIASLLDHPNVVRIYEVARSGTEYFLAMELVQGKSVSALMRRSHETEGGEQLLEPRLAAFLVAQACAGLYHAHNLSDPLGNSLGLVHRDVSPQNILISFEGSVKVIDFGIARALGRISETQTGGMKGKFGYMSPEQARGEEVDLRTDIFALGVVLWEVVTGRRLFNRENDLATMRALVYEPIAKPSTVAAVAPELESIIMRALSRNPKLRYQTARDMGSALERYVVSAGGASASDLSVVMKFAFAAEHSTWQQTLRTVVNLPAITEADLLTPGLTPGPMLTTSVTAVRSPRWPLAAFLVGVAALALMTFLFVRRADTPAPPNPSSAGAGPSRTGEPPPTAPPPTAPANPPVPSIVPLGDPAGKTGPAGSSNIEQKSDPSGDAAGKSRPPRKKRPAGGRPTPTKIDRRPNPF